MTILVNHFFSHGVIFFADTVHLKQAHQTQETDTDSHLKQLEIQQNQYMVFLKSVTYRTECFKPVLRIRGGIFWAGASGNLNETQN